ncbi:YlxM family DNA-binding protein [Carboxydothermus pertinax]|uniref:UPF0122 protein cpu_21880 n=1 Tax=Carboxydothermus pertinax TaxID=870242 RepID=A0A1L8CXN1_9THEO|nr:sigma factor-like helix-turn-helix DNA-binding protein [Carboxydothermus pertinax]GAV23678.1 DNA-binding protein [Carboxydothermus pertinax]
MIDEYARNGSLLELYGKLLTDKQREIMELYYLENWSLAEIAEYFRISRQGVYDILQRAVRQLNFYEGKLGLLKKEEQRQQTLNTIIQDIRKTFNSKEYLKLQPFLEQIKNLFE